MGPTRQSAKRLQPDVDPAVDVVGRDQPNLAGMVRTCPSCAGHTLDLVEPTRLWATQDDR